MSDTEQTYTARTMVKAIQHLRTLDLDQMIDLDLIDYDRLVQVLPVQSYRVVLTKAGPYVIGDIKAIRQYAREGSWTTVSLADAKSWVDKVRDGQAVTVFTTTNESRARELLNALSDNGSGAHIEEIR